jgi:hypothetical protein
MSLVDGELRQIRHMSKGTNEKVTGVIGIEIHDCIRMCATSNNKTLFIA